MINPLLCKYPKCYRIIIKQECRDINKITINKEDIKKKEASLEGL